MKNNDTIKFDSIFDEIKYEFKDLIDFISYMLGLKSNENGIIDLISDYWQHPANDNWPIDQAKNEKKTQNIVVYNLLLTPDGTQSSVFTVGGPVKRKQNHAAILALDLLRRYLQK